MPKIMSLGSCVCEGWQNSAQDLSDRIVSSTATGMNIYPGPMFDFCPYCGRKLVVAGAGHKHVGMWHGKSLLEYNHQELIDIVGQIQRELKAFDDESTERIKRIATGTYWFGR